MKIAFFTEMGFQGKIPRTHENMRVEFAWMASLEATHYNIHDIPKEPYDLGIVIIPKKNPQFEINRIKQFCTKVAVMQEGPHWYFQDYPLEQQIWYFNTLIEADIIFTHNKADQIYYSGLTNHSDVRVMPSLMIEDAVGPLKTIDRENIIIGGNFVNWYGGFDSYMVAREVVDTVYSPSMGRKQPNEESLVKHLPYVNWKNWIHELNKFKVGIHLMRTHAAGTFALNCAYLGIPCIGYKGLDTQETCHPDLTVDIGDLKTAKKLMNKVWKDKEFYVHCSNQCKELYNSEYSEDSYKNKLILK